MSVDPETPHSQYGKVEYKIRIVGKIPRHAPRSAQDEGEYDDSKFIMKGSNLCAIDVTMSHVAAMYATGRLLDTIRQPFNASVIRAEMDALRSRNEAQVSEEDLERWREEAGSKEKIDPLVKDYSHDPSAARNMTPRCPYLYQLAYKSVYVGNDPPYWCGAREEGRRNGAMHYNYRLSLDGPRNVMGRTGLDSFSTSEVEYWYLYIDVSEPLVPRYAFMQRTDIIGCAYGHHNSPSYGHQLRIFNAQHHAARFLIPESEHYPAGEEFGEPRLERHIKCAQPSTTRSWQDRNEVKLQEDPEWREIEEQRGAQARTHPAVVRMRDFAWFREHDVLRSDGTALMQEVWSAAIDYEDLDKSYALRRLVEKPRYVDIARSESLTGVEPSTLKYWEYPLPELEEMSLRGQLGLMVGHATCDRLGQGDVLSRLAAVEGLGSFAIIKALVAQHLWRESSRGGSGIGDATYSWLNKDRSQPEGWEEEPWCAEDYEENASVRKTNTRFRIEDQDRVLGRSKEYSSMVMLYQALCYRASVAQERLRRRGITQSVDSTDAIIFSNLEPQEIPQELPQLIRSGAFSTGEYPGRALGDAAHPAFDVSSFPQMREDAIICALRDWSQQIWTPDLDQNEWKREDGTGVPLRTLNVSGCHYVTRNTIRRALKAVPTITRIIMIGCVSFNEIDLNVLSLDGTLDNVECILTGESLRATFDDPEVKLQKRDNIYKHARSLLPSPNEQARASLLSVPNVFFGSGSKDKFSFKYDAQTLEDYFADGLYNRQPSHTFPRPPSIRADPLTQNITSGSPRFSVVLASHYVAGHPVIGTTLPHVPIDTGIDGVGTSSSGLTAVWRGIIDLVGFLGCNTMRNVQRWNAISWSLLVKACFSGSGSQWGQKSGLTGGGEFFGLPAYFKGGLGQANEEWIFAYQFRDLRGRITTSWMNNMSSFLFPEESAQDSWAFIRYGRDGGQLSHRVPTVVLYDVRGFRQAVCPHVPILPDEAKWIQRVEDVLKNGTWKPHYCVLNGDIDRKMAEEGDPALGRLHDIMERLGKPRFMKESPHELIELIERMMVNQMNDGKDVF